MPDIHPTAIVSPKAELGEGVSIGPYAIVEEGVRIEDRTVVSAHTVIKKYVRIGKNCIVAENAILGGLPQDTRFKGEESFLVLADNVTVREFATLHRATGEGQATEVGSGSYIMAYAHVSHNCSLGDEVTVANAVQLAGHVKIADQAFIGGSTGVHQFVRIGRLAMVGAHSYLTQDLPPFLVGSGHPFYVLGINRVGLERAGVPPERRRFISKLYRLLYHDPRPFLEALDDLTESERSQTEVAQFVEFINSSKRGIRLKTETS
jgi:UDP-N-acetylglucosamine acyltransferase